MHHGPAFIGISTAPISDAARYLLEHKLALPSDVIETYRGKERCMRATVADASRAGTASCPTTVKVDPDATAV